MEKTILILLMIVCTVLHLLAQEVRPKRTPEQEAQRRVEMLSQQLHLSAEQTERIYQIQLKYAHLRRQAVKREDFVELMHDLTDELQMVLTKEQFELYKSWLNGQKHKHTAAFGKTILPTNERADSLGKSL